jgi:thiol-disulfide isomerase/thioredoxin
MPKTPLLTRFLPLLLAAPLAHAQAPPGPPEAGDRLPPIAVEGLTQTEARSFSDFYGRAVLLEFFAHWCGPCALSVPHLNELQEEYGARGFSVVAVTGEGAKKTEPWIRKRGAKYAYGYDPKGEVHGLFQVLTPGGRGIPFAALVDPFGTVLWTGNPSGLNEELIERSLKGASERPVWQWPEEARGLARTLQRGDLAAAAKEAALLPSPGGTGSFDAPALVRERIAAHLAQFERLVADRDYREGLDFGARLVGDLGDLPEAARLAARITEVGADPEVKETLALLDRLDGFEQRANAIRKLAEAEQLRPEVAAFVEECSGKRCERRGRALLDSIDRGIEKAKKKQEQQG